MVSFEDAYRTDLETSTGGYIQVTPEVIRKISARKKNSTKFLIGIASGAPGCLQKRWEEVCESKKMKWITVVYKTSSLNFRDSLFRELKKIMKNVKALNVTLVHQNLFLIKNGLFILLVTIK
ncbi:hypothetical protein EMCRGX_G001993 [Ephydatia muelleri]